MSAGRSDVIEIYLQVPPEEIAYVKFIFESYEGVAVVRTIDRKRAVIVLMVAPDLLDEAQRILDAIRSEVEWKTLPVR